MLRRAPARAYRHRIDIRTTRHALYQTDRSRSSGAPRRTDGGRSTMAADARISKITARIVERSKPTRERYLDRLRNAATKGAQRSVLGCANLAHGFAVCS